MAVYKRKVLLIGIDAHEAPYLVDRLRRHGHPLAFAGNGASGLLDAHRERPALVVAAGRMPIMNGYQFLQVLRQDAELGNTPVILVSDTDDVEEMARAGLAGADLCLSRHSSAADICLCVDRALRLAAGEGTAARRDTETMPVARVAPAPVGIGGQPEERPEEAWAGAARR